MARVRHGISERVQQLETQIQGKLEQARERRENIEHEQKQKLRIYVSCCAFAASPNLGILFYEFPIRMFLAVSGRISRFVDT